MARVVNSSSAEKYATKAWWAACRRIWHAKYPMNCRYKLIMCCVCDMSCSCMHVLYFYVCIVLLQTLIACHSKQQMCKDHEETIPWQVTISHSFSSCLLCPSLGLFNFRFVFLLAKFIALNAKQAWQVEAWRGVVLSVLSQERLPTAMMCVDAWLWTRMWHWPCQLPTIQTGSPSPVPLSLPADNPNEKTMEKIAHTPCCAMQQQQLRQQQQQQRRMSSSFT